LKGVLLNYLIILILIAVVVGPIFGLMPSSKQKRQMKLRDKALELGFHVKICHLPQVHRAKVRKEDSVEGVAYRLPRNKPNRKGVSEDSGLQVLCLRDGAEQDIPKSHNAYFLCLQEALAALPSDVVALEMTALWYGIYWSEHGSVEDVLIFKNQLDLMDKKIAMLESA